MKVLNTFIFLFLFVPNAFAVSSIPIMDGNLPGMSARMAYGDTGTDPNICRVNVLTDSENPGTCSDEVGNDWTCDLR